MVEYFVTKGKLVVRNDESLVVTDGEAKSLSKIEFILWSSLHWNILNKESLKAEFDERMKKYHINADVSFEQTLNRLKSRGLVASKSDYLAADALYNLIKDLYVVPLGTVNKVKRIFAFCYMFFAKGMSYSKSRDFFEGFKLTETEKRIATFTKRIKVSGAELIRIHDKDLWDIKSEDDIVPLAYDKHEDMKSIGNYTRFSENKINVLEAIVNLYLKKQIVFE